MAIRDDVSTPLEYILSLNWTKDILEESKKFLADWDERDKSFYNTMTNVNIRFDMTEREHLRNTIKFYEKRLNETKSP